MSGPERDGGAAAGAGSGERDADGAGDRDADGGSDGEDEYVVAVKASARRRSAAAGEWVRDHGPRRAFASKPLAREWARELGGRDATLWVQDANPGDDVDGYLVGGARRGNPAPGRPGDQVELDAAGRR